MGQKMPISRKKTEIPGSGGRVMNSASLKQHVYRMTVRLLRPLAHHTHLSAPLFRVQEFLVSNLGI
jgi:hypothetical protein